MLGQNKEKGTGREIQKDNPILGRVQEAQLSLVSLVQHQVMWAYPAVN